jgi:hypothetical protein
VGGKLGTPEDPLQGFSLSHGIRLTQKGGKYRGLSVIPDRKDEGNASTGEILGFILEKRYLRQGFPKRG